MSQRIVLLTEEDTLALGAELAKRWSRGGVVYLSGDLGVGKTTLVRGWLRGLGFKGRVKSPSYGLIESYEIDELTVHHLDLYRLGDAEEIEYLGIEDLFVGPTLMLVEWAERGQGHLPPADLTIDLSDKPEGGREAVLS